MKKKYWVTIVFILLIIIAFYLGTRLGGTSSSPQGNFDTASSGDMPSDFQPGQMTGMGGGAGRGAVAQEGETMTRGEILSIDDNSIVVKTEDNGSKIILFSDATEIKETLSVSADNLTEGKSVMVGGEENDEGTITAITIFVRDLDDEPPFGGPPSEEGQVDEQPEQAQ